MVWHQIWIVLSLIQQSIQVLKQGSFELSLSGVRGCGFNLWSLNLSARPCTRRLDFFLLSIMVLAWNLWSSWEKDPCKFCKLGVCWRRISFCTRGFLLLYLIFCWFQELCNHMLFPQSKIFTNVSHIIDNCRYHHFRNHPITSCNRINHLDLHLWTRNWKLQRRNSECSDCSLKFQGQASRSAHLSQIHSESIQILLSSWYISREWTTCWMRAFPLLRACKNRSRHHACLESAYLCFEQDFFGLLGQVSCCFQIKYAQNLLDLRYSGR